MVADFSGFCSFPPNRVTIQAETSSMFNFYSHNDEKRNWQLARAKGPTPFDRIFLQPRTPPSLRKLISLKHCLFPTPSRFLFLFFLFCFGFGFFFVFLFLHPAIDSCKVTFIAFILHEGKVLDER